MSEHRFLLRVPSELWDRVRDGANVSQRSLNAEIVWLLEGAVAHRAERPARSTWAAPVLSARSGPPEVPASVPVFKPDFKR